MARPHPTHSDRRAQRIERALGVALAAGILLLAVYGIGASGIPGEAFAALIDWAVAKHPTGTGSPVLQAAVAAWG